MSKHLMVAVMSAAMLLAGCVRDTEKNPQNYIHLHKNYWVCTAKQTKKEYCGKACFHDVEYCVRWEVK